MCYSLKNCYAGRLDPISVREGWPVGHGSLNQMFFEIVILYSAYNEGLIVIVVKECKFIR